VSPPEVALAQLTDPHIGVNDDAAAEALADAVRCVLAVDFPPAAVLVSGDLAANGQPAEYERVRELLAPLPMPVHVLPGNHDDRDQLCSHFGATGDGGLLRYSVRCGPVRLVACDTIQPGRDDGSMDSERLAWLEAELDADRETPTIVAMHHPPLLTGIRGLDEIGIPAEQRAALAEVVTRNPQVKRIIGGHVHRQAVGELGGCPVLACPSTHLQALFDLHDDAGLALAPEPPGFGLHLIVEGELVSHVLPIGKWEPAPMPEPEP
jgi:3',5'-cyclic AMP phosphodiesterase CpdA